MSLQNLPVPLSHRSNKGLIKTSEIGRIPGCWSVKFPKNEDENQRPDCDDCAETGFALGTLGKERDWAVSLQPRQISILKWLSLGLNHRLVMTMKSFSNFDTVWVSCHVWSARFNPPERSFFDMWLGPAFKWCHVLLRICRSNCVLRDVTSREVHRCWFSMIAEIATSALKGAPWPCAHDPQGIPRRNFTSQSN